jgi:FKBP-type peptidyl-prolyl cis-trans isomerase FkpA
MTKQKFATLFSFFSIGLLMMSSCKHQQPEKMTDSGMKYIVYKENPGPKAKLGDFVTIEMIYKTENDSVLFDSRQNRAPMRFQLEQIPFSGSMEEGITYMAAGDSATFFVSADSMVQKVFSKIAGENYVRPAFLKAGSKLKFDIKLLRIQSELDAAEEMYKELDRLAALEKSNIEKYVKEHKITQQPDSNGIYVIVNTPGKGAAIDSGKTVLINYTGKFLSGEVFDSNDKDGKPVAFVHGKDDMMKGWNIAFKKLRKGDHATLIIPSPMAFGEEGLRNKMNGNYLIQPNTPLLYEVEVLEVK